MKKYLFPILILIIASGLFLYKKYNPINIPTPKQNTGYEQRVNLVIDYGNKETKSFDVSTGADASAYSILKTTAEKENINLQVKQYDFGIFVEKIGDFESTAKKSWIYYVNSESGQIAADQQKLKNGDRVEWKYEIPKL